MFASPICAGSGFSPAMGHGWWLNAPSEDQDFCNVIFDISKDRYVSSNFVMFSIPAITSLIRVIRLNGCSPFFIIRLVE